jgi:hypothetical protein
MNEYLSAQVAEIVKKVVANIEKETAKSDSCPNGRCDSCSD